MATKTATKKTTAKKTNGAAKKTEKKAEGNGFKMVHGGLCHIEFHVADLKKAEKFYSALFGWQFHPHQPKEMYFQMPGNGMGGCVLEGKPSKSGSTFYVMVDGIETTVAKAKKLGGKEIQKKTAIAGNHGYYARLRSPEGSECAIWCMS